jgi:hypothetical protein
MRMSPDERLRFKRVAEHMLGVDNIAGVIRMLVIQAERRMGSAPSPAMRADAAWARAHASFLETGARFSNVGVIAIDKHVKATAKALDELMSLARQCGESRVHDAAARFREKLLGYPNLHGQDRAKNGLTIAGLFEAQADVSQEMFAWAARRAAAAG